MSLSSVLFFLRKTFLRRVLSKLTQIGKICFDVCLPSSRNGYTARIISPTAVAFGAALVLSSQVMVLSVSVLLPTAQASESELSEVQIVSETNLSREQFGRSALVINPVLTQAAEKKAKDMAMKGYFSHISPEGKTPWNFFEESGYQYMIAGENLGLNFSESGELNKAWMKSPGHRANILNPDFEEIGVGIASSLVEGRNVVYVVQFFATPAEKNIFLTNIPTPLKYADGQVGKPSLVLPRQSSEVLKVTPGEKGVRLSVRLDDDVLKVRLVDIKSRTGYMLDPRSFGVWDTSLNTDEAEYISGLWRIEVFKASGQTTVLPVAEFGHGGLGAKPVVLGEFSGSATKPLDSGLKDFASFVAEAVLLVLLVGLAVNFAYKPRLLKTTAIANVSLLAVFCTFLAF